MYGSDLIEWVRPRKRKMKPSPLEAVFEKLPFRRYIEKHLRDRELLQWKHHVFEWMWETHHANGPPSKPVKIVKRVRSAECAGVSDFYDGCDSEAVSLGNRDDSVRLLPGAVLEPSPLLPAIEVEGSMDKEVEVLSVNLPGRSKPYDISTSPKAMPIPCKMCAVQFACPDKYLFHWINQLDKANLSAAVCFWCWGIFPN